MSYNAECHYSILGQQKYIHALTLTIKLLEVLEWKIMAVITEKSAIFVFSADLVYCCCIRHSANYACPGKLDRKEKLHKFLKFGI